LATDGGRFSAASPPVLKGMSRRGRLVAMLWLWFNPLQAWFCLLFFGRGCNEVEKVDRAFFFHVSVALLDERDLVSTFIRVAGRLQLLLGS